MSEEEHPHISVITPVYNVESYLAECLDSLVAQTMDSIEFICVNDGSTDSCPAILSAYAEQDSRIRVVTQENGGYGKAMNAGLDAARGDYIGIVESDDFADPEMFERLYALAEQNDCDIVKGNYFAHDLEHGSVYCEGMTGCTYDEVLAPVEHPELFRTTPIIWAAIYRRNHLVDNGIRFLETPGASYQDTGFVMKNWLFAERVYLVRDAYLHYRVDNGGSSVKQPGKVFCVCDEFASIEEALKRRPDVESVLAGALMVKKFETYEWNLGRLAMPYKYAFLMRWSAEFADARERGWLDEGLFTPEEWERVVEVIEDPGAVIADDVQVSLRAEKDAAEAARLRKELARVKASTTWRVGRAATALPRALKRKVRGRS